MNPRRPLFFVSSVLACLGMILPSSMLQAAQPAQASARRLPTISDVELGPQGVLRGVVISSQGVPVTRTTIVVYDAKQEVARTKTDTKGCFSVGRLPSGTLRVTAGRYSTPIRAWAARTGPPKCKQIALVVVGSDIVRGQRHWKDAFCNHDLLVGGVIAAMIALPIIVYSSNRKPASP